MFDRLLFIRWWIGGCAVALGCGLSVGRAAGYGFDAGQSAEQYAQVLADGGLSGENGQWVRMRGLVESEGSGTTKPQAEEQMALRRLRERGVKVCVILRWGTTAWKNGVRAGGGQRLPVDLREAFERGRRLGAVYGGLVDAWEIENEPDIGFVMENPEVMAAFFKACSLGIKQGAESCERKGAGGSIADGPAVRPYFESSWRAQKWGRVAARGDGLSPFGLHASPLVLMPPMALPPGPYFERFWSNGIASYTDGFNYHYYGYAEDFTGVYRQFEDAVTEPPTHGPKRMARRTLPVFLTEYGYGLMDGVARDTVEGRVRQWRWFADVAGQIHTLRPEGPMAFVLNPYLEEELNEFGLLMGKRPSYEPEAKGSQLSAYSPALVFRPADFGAAKAQPWMGRIGEKLGEAYASPALAYLQDYAAGHPYRARAWPVRAEAPARVVIDFVAGGDMRQAKDYGGYWLKGRTELKAESPELGAGKMPRSGPVRTGHGKVVLYNFSDRAVTGSLVFSPAGAVTAEGGPVFTLAAGERREVAVTLAVREDGFTGTRVGAVFVPAGRGGPEAVWGMLAYPGGESLVRRRLADFNFPGKAAEVARGVLLARPLAAGEPPLHEDGRWLVSDGVSVTESGDEWRLEVRHFPAQPLRPAMAELPLPEGFACEQDAMLLFEHRKGAVTTAAAGGAVEAARTRVGKWGEAFDVYLRAANGNLYQVSPRLQPGAGWTLYGQCARNFTMGFFGRAALPWRFADNRPVSLVFFLRPETVPFALEVRRAAVVRFERADGR